MADMRKTAGGGGSVPVPDPTELTTASLLREVGALKELIEAKLTALDGRIDGIHAHVNSLPVEREAHITSLKEWIVQRFATVEEKFVRIDTQFSERDTRGERSAAESKEALAAALQAAKELVGNQNASSTASIAKSDTATEKQFNTLVLTMTTSNNAMSDKIDDLKARITRVESQIVGGHEARADVRAGGSSVATIVGVASAIIFGLVSIVISSYHVIRVAP